VATKGPRKARRGDSREREGALAGMNLSGRLWEEETQLRELRCLDPRQERDRLAAVSALSAAREPVRRWQRWLERDLARAEGYGELPRPTPPWAA
jgi:hypothetical protein